jgi:YopT-type cysteine protease-like protein
MPHAYDVMIETKNHNPEVSHTFYAQGEYKWVSMFTGQEIERKKGVCNGLCLRWIKSAHQTSLIKILSSDSTDKEKKPDLIRASVVRIQEKSVELNKKSLLLSRKHGGFGSLAVVQFSDSTYFMANYEYPNQDWSVGIMCPNQSALRKKVAESVAESRANYKYASVIHMSPDDPDKSGHAVAVVASTTKVRFFDPNGGVLEFKSRDLFRSWFENDFGQISFYGDRGTLFQVVNYHYVKE